jgi:hypothetical protein
MASYVRCTPPGKSPWVSRQNGSTGTSRLRLSRSDIAQQTGHLDLAAAAWTSNGLACWGNKPVAFPRPMGHGFRPFAQRNRVDRASTYSDLRGDFPLRQAPLSQQPANFVNHSCRNHRQNLPKNRHTRAGAPSPIRRPAGRPPTDLPQDQNLLARPENPAWQPRCFFLETTEFSTVAKLAHNVHNYNHYFGHFMPFCADVVPMESSNNSRKCDRLCPGFRLK